jgi:hypothetical protein
MLVRVERFAADLGQTFEYEHRHFKAVRIRKFVTRFTKLGIRKSIYFSFRIFFKRILRKTIKTSANKHPEDARGRYCGDTRGYLVCIG